MPENMDWSEHCKIINKNPVVYSSMFNKHTNHLIKDLVLSQYKPIGNVTDIFCRIQFQQSGWPHIHALFWITDAPKVSASNSEVVKFVDKYISCKWPDDTCVDLQKKISSVQTHSKNIVKLAGKAIKHADLTFQDHHCVGHLSADP